MNAIQEAIERLMKEWSLGSGEEFQVSKKDGFTLFWLPASYIRRCPTGFGVDFPIAILQPDAVDPALLKLTMAVSFNTSYIDTKNYEPKNDNLCAW